MHQGHYSDVLLFFSPKMSWLPVKVLKFAKKRLKNIKFNP